MFVLTRDVSASYKAIATLVAAALVLATIGIQTQKAAAADLVNVRDLITDSAPGADANHTFSFDLVSDLTVGQDIVIDFDATDGFDFTGLVAGDVTGIAPDNNFTVVVDTVNDDITLTRTVSTAASGTSVTIDVGGTNFINNPPSPLGGNESYEITISAGTSGTPEDQGKTRIVILDTVLVTATVDTVFDFFVDGRAGGFVGNGWTTTGPSSSTTIPFGTLAHDTEYQIAQDLRVVTNSANGFIVTVQTDGDFESTNGGVIDNFQDASDVAVPTNWAAPADQVSTSTTWGHWGVTSLDDDATNGEQVFGSDQWMAASTSPRILFAHNGPADGSTPDIGSTTVAYKVEITPLQEAGDDYQTTLTYIATPTF